MARRRRSTPFAVSALSSFTSSGRIERSREASRRSGAPMVSSKIPFLWECSSGSMPGTSKIRRDRVGSEEALTESGRGSATSRARCSSRAMPSAARARLASSSTTSCGRPGSMPCQFSGIRSMKMRSPASITFGLKGRVSAKRMPLPSGSTRPTET